MAGDLPRRRDSRPVVPKRNPLFGLTLNLGHPVGLALFIAILAVVAAGLVLGW